MSTVTEPPPRPKPVPGPVAPQARRPRRSSRIGRILLTLALCLVLLTLGMNSFEFFASQKKEPPRQNEEALLRTYNVTVFRVQAADLQRIIPAFGTARADREVVLAAEVAGRIVDANNLDVGRSVAAGQVIRAADGTTRREQGDLIVQIDPKTYQERVVQAMKLIAQDDVDLKRLQQENENDKRLLLTEQANLKTAKEEYDTAVRIQGRGGGTGSSVRRAELDMRRYEEAVIQLENEIRLYEARRDLILSRRDAHQSDLQLAQQDRDRTEVYPPFDAVLSEVMAERGQYVRPGEPLVRLTDPTRVEVPLSLTLADFLEISELSEQGKTVKVALAENESSEPRWCSDPREDVRLPPEADERTRTVKIFVEVDNTQQTVPLLPGTFAYARIEGQIVPDAIVIPRDAVIDGHVFVAVPEPQGGDVGQVSNLPPKATGNIKLVENLRHSAKGSHAWFARVQRRPVTTTRTMQSLVRVAAGLRPGEWIVVTNLDVMFEGARLKIEPGEGECNLADELARLRIPQVRIVEPSADSRAGL